VKKPKIRGKNEKRSEMVHHGSGATSRGETEFDRRIEGHTASCSVKFLRAVHILLTPTVSSSGAAGLRLRIDAVADKKKSEFYFFGSDEKT
jgi:hypothetical protein